MMTNGLGYGILVVVKEQLPSVKIPRILTEVRPPTAVRRNTGAPTLVGI